LDTYLENVSTNVHFCLTFWTFVTNNKVLYICKVNIDSPRSGQHFCSFFIASIYMGSFNMNANKHNTRLAWNVSHNKKVWPTMPTTYNTYPLYFCYIYAFPNNVREFNTHEVEANYSHRQTSDTKIIE